MSLLTAMEKLWFPGFVLFLQALMLVLFGVLVEYDEFGSPVTEENTTPPDSDGTIQTFYPRTFNNEYNSYYDRDGKKNG